MFPRCLPFLSLPRFFVFFLLFVMALWLSVGPAAQFAHSTANAGEIGGTGGDFFFRLAIQTNEIEYNPNDQLLYATRPSATGAEGNSITRINPLTGEVVGTVYVGSEPNKLAISDDGQTLYVALDGAYAVRRYDVSTQSPSQQFSIGRGQSVNAQDSPYRASSLAVVPGNPDKVVVARYLPGISPPGTGAALFENGVRAPQTGPGHSNAALHLAFSYSPSVLYGGGIDGGLRTYTVTENGIAEVSGTTTPVTVRALKFQGGRVYTSNGHVIDPETRTVVGTCAGVDTTAFVPDTSTGRLLYTTREGSNVTVRACDTNTFTSVGSPLTIPNVGYDVQITTLVRFGTNGLALRTSNGQIYFIFTSLIPTDDPLPAPSATPANTPTPTPTPYARFIRSVSLPNRDLLIRNTDQKFYASVPTAAPVSVANSITRIDPTTGALEHSIPVGNEPGRLAFTDNEQTLYVGINGSNAIRKVDMQSGVPGTQFPLGTGVNGPLTAYDINVLPGTSDSLAVSYGSSSYNYDGVHIYDNGVRRSQKANLAGRIHVSSSETLYIGDNYIGKFGISAAGLTQQARFSTNSAGSESVLIGNRLYTSGGGVIDLNSPSFDFLGSFTGIGYRPGLAVDEANNRILYLVNTSDGTPAWAIMAFRLDNFQPLGSIPLPGVTLGFPYPDSPHRLIRWGQNGLAFHNNLDKIYFVQSDLISSEGIVPSALQLSASAFTFNESGGTLSLTVLRTGGITGTTTVDYATADGTATAGTDYIAAAGTLTFAPGESSKTINIPIINDNVYEGPNETFTLELSNPGGDGPVEIFQPSVSTVTIEDNEGTPSINGANITIAEPRTVGTTEAVFTVQLSNATFLPVTVNYSTINGTATAGNDYVSASGTLTFAPFETTKSVTVLILPDRIYNEPNEYFWLTFSNPVNAWLSGSQPRATINNFNPANIRHAGFDFDDDGKADVGIFRPQAAEWWISRSSDGEAYAARFGASDDVIVPADHTGDGKTDIAVWRPTNGTWFVLRSEDFTFYAFPFGTTGDVPVPGDYDGDGISDAAIFRPWTTTWFIRHSSSDSVRIFQFGASGDLPVVSDYDGDGKADTAMYRPSLGEWWIDRSSLGVIAYTFGTATDKAVPGDYTGDGRSDVAFWRPSSGEWFVLRSSDSSYYSTQFGVPGDLPAPGDYDGDGRHDPTIFRPSSGTWYSQRSTAGTLIQQFGANGDRPVANAFVR